MELNENDTLKLGASAALFTVRWKPFVVCFSTVDASERANYKNKVKELGRLVYLVRCKLQVEK